MTGRRLPEYPAASDRMPVLPRKVALSAVKPAALRKELTMSSILTNTSAMVALQTMKGINANLNKTQADISTGKSVASAKDNAAYWRAKEGELARTLLAMPEIRAARVHIASAPTRAFQPETAGLGLGHADHRFAATCPRRRPARSGIWWQALFPA